MEDQRLLALEHIRAQLVGPAEGADEQIRGKPFHRYMCGILFPHDMDINALGESDEPDVTSSSVEEEVADPALGLAYADLPSSMGISFFTAGAEELHCLPTAARYFVAKDDKTKETVWNREDLINPAELPVRAKIPAGGAHDIKRVDVFGGLAQVHFVFRPRGNGHLVTVTLINAQQSDGSSMYEHEQVEAMLFQCGFEVRSIGGSIGEYPHVQNLVQHRVKSYPVFLSFWMFENAQHSIKFS